MPAPVGNGGTYPCTSKQGYPLGDAIKRASRREPPREHGLKRQRAGDEHRHKGEYSISVPQPLSLLFGGHDSCRPNTALSCEGRFKEDGARSAPTNRLLRFVSFSALFDGTVLPFSHPGRDEAQCETLNAVRILNPAKPAAFTA
jgi:hypothetical protein